MISSIPRRRYFIQDSERVQKVLVQFDAHRVENIKSSFDQIEVNGGGGELSFPHTLEQVTFEWLFWGTEYFIDGVI